MYTRVYVTSIKGSVFGCRVDTFPSAHDSTRPSRICAYDHTTVYDIYNAYKHRCLSRVYPIRLDPISYSANSQPRRITCLRTCASDGEKKKFVNVERGTGATVACHAVIVPSACIIKRFFFPVIIRVFDDFVHVACFIHA